MLTQVPTPVWFALAAVTAAGLAAAWSWTTCPPDEWLLRIRNGRLEQAGIGISLWRRPGDVLARFSSTMQRVSFSLEALSSERLKVALEGFALWSVSPEGDGPFRAFRSLGLANLFQPPAGLKHARHLLTGPQYRAMQQLLVSLAQRLVITKSLRQLLGEQDQLVRELRAQLTETMAPMGIELNEVQIVRCRPAETELLEQLGCGEQEKIREEAEQIRMATRERLERQQLEIATRRAKEEAEADRQRESHRARAKLELEQERTAMTEAQNLEIQKQIESAARLAERKAQLAHTAGMLIEEQKLETLRQQLRQEQLRSERAMQLQREQAEADRESQLALLAVEEGKSSQLRRHELARLTAEQVGKALRVTDARWVTVSDSSPLSGVSQLIAGMGAVVQAGQRLGASEVEAE